MYNISRSWVDVLIVYVLLFGIVYLDWWQFRDESDKRTASNFVQVSEKVQRRLWLWIGKLLEKKTWAVHGKYKPTETEKARQMKRKVSSMLIIRFDINGTVLIEFVLAGQTVISAYYCDVLRRLPENMRRLRPELWRKELAVASRQSTVSHIPFSPRNF
jgi:hypothetical protein